MSSYAIQRSKIVYEVLNSEVIVVDFYTGNYYALTHVARQVWQLLEEEIPLNQMAQILSNLYERDKTEIIRDLDSFCTGLLEEGIIAPCESFEKQIHLEVVDWEYSAPKFQKFTDVQNLLLLDPIHEVSEVGWPEKLEQ